MQCSIKPTVRILIFFFFLISCFLLHWVFVATCELSPVVASGEPAVRRLLIVVASPVAEHELSGTRASVVAVHGLSSSGTQGLVSLWHVGSSLTTYVPYIGRWIRKHWNTREVQDIGLREVESHVQF